MTSRLALCAAGWALLSIGCEGLGGGGDAPKSKATAAAPVASEVSEAQGLLGAGRVDEAIARLEQNPSPDAAYVLGEAWSKKAESAPLPLPAPLPPDAQRGAVPVTPEFKPEELHAIEAYEKAIAGKPDDPRPKVGLARLLTPHAQRQYDASLAPPPASKPGKPGRTSRGRAPEPTATPAPVVASGPDFSPARVSGLLRAAAAKATSVDPIEALYAFAVRVGQLEDADWALQERIRREKENPEHLLRYGDFLRQVKKNPDAAVEQYRQALIWRPDDAVAKSRIGDIYIDAGNTHYQNGEYALAEARYLDAVKWVPDKQSEQGQRLQHEIDKVRRLRR
jgi:tetratricopeptide (TPR) repeat protein